MKMICIKKSSIPDAMARAGEQYKIAGPVKDKDGFAFKVMDGDETPDLDYQEDILSPKNIVFPQTESMFHFTRNNIGQAASDLKDISFDETPLAIVGIRPYDALAIEILKKNFITDTIIDPYFAQRYENMTLVGLAENNPGSTNFSTSCGTGPFDETFLDILLVDMGNEFKGKILTPKGESFAAAAGFPMTDDNFEKEINELKKEAESKTSSRMSFDSIKNKETQDLYDAPFWEDMAFPCINCSACTFVCPTCWCFDIQDENIKEKGARIRMWDSCMNEMYTAHASGHNPRKMKWQRFRNRFMHKLKYFGDKYGKGIMCVGCGRCITSCPANIDIREIAGMMSQEGETK